MNAIVSTSDLTRKFDKMVAIKRLTLEIPSGGVVGLVGPNGSEGMLAWSHSTD
jgi:ABC-2 type transport system ATP-binding protein